MQLKEEIWGCFKYIGIPLDEIMKMPVGDRKFFIMKHNADQNNIQRDLDKDKQTTTIEGQGLNTYAAIAQNNPNKI